MESRKLEADAPKVLQGQPMAKIKTVEDPTPAPDQNAVAIDTLAQALTKAIENARPEKKTPFNRKIQTPWTPKDGSPKLKLKRKIFQHGLPAEEEILSNEEITALNQLRPGIYMDGTVKVNRRKDRGLDISYPLKTASQRLKLVNQYGVRNLVELCERCIQEAAKPKAERESADLD